jgi:hypothetical protein
LLVSSIELRRLADGTKQRASHLCGEIGKNHGVTEVESGFVSTRFRCSKIEVTELRRKARLEKEMGLRHLDHEWEIHQEGGAENAEYKRRESTC